MKKALLIIILTAGLISSACSQKQNEGTSAITVDSLKASMNHPQIVILDVRTPEEYAEGHVAGAVNIDYRNPDFSKNVESLDKNKSYEVYCHSGKRSAASTQILNEKGFKAVNVTGGMMEWEGKGFPVAK